MNSPNTIRGSSLSTIRALRVCSNIGDLKNFKVAPKYQSSRRVDMILMLNQKIHWKIGDEIWRIKAVY
ncbi:hypothetical protein GIB67_030631 [Kingdonia uniflora]|uniref:Uncharacterized protein n=1 Tax=Kingdonia uniflora TaxID=39325 RepID=A0A7J7LMF9_9MAGN|nr:hypothetical protein GIB67_030631 [Kingdonia uniflora]